jgi:hypothetical protein
MRGRSSPQRDRIDILVFVDAELFLLPVLGVGDFEMLAPSAGASPSLLAVA